MTKEGRKQYHEAMLAQGRESPYAKEFEVQEEVKPQEKKKNARG